MKPLLVVSLLGAGILFTGCETTVVERDHHYGHGSGYRGNSVVVVDGDRGRYDRYDHRHDRDYRGDYRTRNVERTNVNISETNVNRTYVNRTNVNQNIKQAPRGNGRPGYQAHAQVQVQKKGDDKHKGKKKDDDHRQ